MEHKEFIRFLRKKDKEGKLDDMKLIHVVQGGAIWHVIINGEKYEILEKD